MHQVIDLRDYFTVLAVWELNEKGRWRLLELARLNRAIALCRELNGEEKLERLVFPTRSAPHQVLAAMSALKKRSLSAGFAQSSLLSTLSLDRKL